MKTVISCLVLMVLAFPALSCDESCMRDRASLTHDIEFPSYLTWKFCEDTKTSFMEGDIRSLENYRHNRLDLQHRVRMKNIQKFVEQRKDWLKECDRYMELTDHGRIFKDKATTDRVFAAMDEVIEELNSLVAGATYTAAEDGQTTIIANKFDSLFKAVDDHKAVMMLRGQFVAH